MRIVASTAMEGRNDVDSGHQARIDAGVSFDWTTLPPLLETLDGVPSEGEALHFRRRGRSHRGLAAFQRLKVLWLHQADQDCIDEIGRLSGLETLHVRGLTARSLDALSENLRLRRLILVGGSKIEDLAWIEGLPEGLEILFLEGFYRVDRLDMMSRLVNLRSLGFEGGMDRHVRVDSLAPLAGLDGLRAVFLASARIADASLAPLRGLRKLERLECAIHFPESEFTGLRDSLPGLSCDWIRMIEEHGGLKQGKAAMMARIRRG